MGGRMGVEEEEGECEGRRYRNKKRKNVMPIQEDSGVHIRSLFVVTSSSLCFFLLLNGCLAGLSFVYFQCLC